MVGRVTLDQRDVQAWVREVFTRRARQALAIYRRTPLELDEAGYPFRSRPEDGSIRDPKNSSIQNIPGGVRITVQSRGAPFFEGGNDRGGEFITGNLALPLKTSQRKKSGRVVIGVDGRPVLMVQRVRTYRGRHALERSVRIAFTGNSR